MFMERRAVFAELRDRLIVIGYLRGLAVDVYRTTLAFSFSQFSSCMIYPSCLHCALYIYRIVQLSFV
jgi:hypothetical protein